MAIKIVPTPEVRRARALVAVRAREHGTDAPQTTAARETYRSAEWLAAVDQIVNDAPPLTAEQRARLAQILAPAVAAASVEGAAA